MPELKTEKGTVHFPYDKKGKPTKAGERKMALLKRALAMKKKENEEPNEPNS